MEEDIKVLEEIINSIDFNNEYQVFVLGINQIELIQNLIKGYKELEEERNENSILYIKPMDEYLKDKIFRLEKDLEQIIKERDYFKSKVIEYNEKINNYIPKSKIREKMNKDINTNEHTILGGRRNKKTLEYGIRLGRIQMCEELLQEGDDK